MEISEWASLSLPLHRITALPLTLMNSSVIVIISFLKHLSLVESRKQVHRQILTDRGQPDSKKNKKTLIERQEYTHTHTDFVCVRTFVSINPAAKGLDPLCKLLIVSHCSAGL